MRNEAAIDKLRVRKKAYQTIFASREMTAALADLANFCGAFGTDLVLKQSTDVSIEKTLVMRGRRDAFFRIFQHLHLEPDELALLYRAVTIPQENT